MRGNTGDPIQEGQRLGSATRLMDGAWWCTTLVTPGEPSPRLSVMEKSLPGSCVVNMNGERFANDLFTHPVLVPLGGIQKGDPVRQRRVDGGDRRALALLAPPAAAGQRPAAERKDGHLDA